MAEDDEVDVLGDYSFDLLNKNDSFDGTPLVSQNSDLLNCDYTIHPQWLLDRPSANPALWYNTSDLHVPDCDMQVETTQQNSITDESGWTEKEKDLLNRGIEIFGKSNLNLSQFIGSRTPVEVKYFLKNFYSDIKLSYTSINEDILFDNCVEETVVTSESVLQEYEIPASIEEVVGSVSEAKSTTIPRKKANSSRKMNCTGNMSYDDVPYGESLLKSTYQRQATGKFNNNPKAKQRTLKVKFKTKLKILPQSVKPSRKTKVTRRFLVASRHSESDFSLNQKSLKQEEISEISLKKNLRIVTGNGLGVPVCDGEEVVKIIKDNNTESESDVDVEDSNDENSKENSSSPQLKKQDSLEMLNEVEIAKTQEKLMEVNPNVNLIANKKVNIIHSGRCLPKHGPKLEDLPESVVKELLSMEEPSSEVVIPHMEISNVEKFLFYEFFESRPTRTAARYLHIRNHILDKWTNAKPNYLRKTAIRNGLTQAGDMNMVGKIHSYLEQIGAINFQCEQTNYCRPLLKLIAVATTKPKEKLVLIKNDNLPRQRIKKRERYKNDGEGGYTLTHDEKGQIINTTVVNEEPAVRQKSYMKKPSIRLIYCRPFTKDCPQKYSISLNISTLLMMDLHAHMHLTEVMGLIGGHWHPATQKMFIKRYFPCRNIASSLTHCDMCPISQARAAETIHNENLDILGWYHSHPTFAPEPSQQDIETQLNVQQWIGSCVPCIGFILSPFSLHGALIASPYRCMLVNRSENSQVAEPRGGSESQAVPYKFKVDLQVDSTLDVEDVLNKAKEVLKHNIADVTKNRVDFGKAYFQDDSITYLDKYLYSVRMHLAKCSEISKMTCDDIIGGLRRVCTQYSSATAKK